MAASHLLAFPMNNSRLIRGRRPAETSNTFILLDGKLRDRRDANPKTRWRRVAAQEKCSCPPLLLCLSSRMKDPFESQLLEAVQQRSWSKKGRTAQNSARTQQQGALTTQRKVGRMNQHC